MLSNIMKSNYVKVRLEEYSTKLWYVNLTGFLYSIQLGLTIVCKALCVDFKHGFCPSLGYS